MIDAKPSQTKRPWTLGRVLRAIAFWWLLLLALSAPGRICEPLLSSKCALQAWNYIGDVVWLKGLYEWQTMATGVIALLAAAIGAWFLHLQIQLEEERRRRISASVRALMPHTFGALMDYLDECYVALAAARAGGTFVKPESPASVVAELQRMVEVSDDIVATPFSALLRQLQILNARLRHLHKQGPPSMKTNISAYVMNTAEIHAAVSKLFPFSRGETEELPTPSQIAEQYVPSLKVIGVHEIDFADVYKTAKERSEKITGATLLKAN